MRVYDKKEVIKVEKVLTSIKCNGCRKDISETDIDYFYTVTTSHSLWGNDSIDSVEHLDFCSYDCLVNNMNEYFSDADDTYCFEIERESK